MTPQHRNLSLPGSLRARLLLFLLAAVALVAMIQAGFAYKSARDESDTIFDYHMEQMALSLRNSLAFAPQQPDTQSRITENGNEFIVQIWGFDGASVFQSERDILLGQTVLGFTDVKPGKITYRVYSLRTPLYIIQVAQDVSVRSRMASALALRTTLPVLLLAPILMALVWWVINRTMAPLATVRRQLAVRRAEDLSGVSTEGVPDEIRPLVEELNHLLLRLAQAFDAQKRFVANAAHELRTPLAALRLQAQGIQRASDEAGRTIAVQRLLGGMDRTTRLVEQMLVLARQQEKALESADKPPCRLAELAREAIAERAPLAQQKHIDIGLLEADEGLIPAQRDALVVLLSNLIDNAIKYTPEGGVVDVSVKPAGGHLNLVVEDSGPGIAPAERERALDRFHRLGSGDVSGSGLGLSIVKAICDAHHAQLILDASPRLGGLRVTVGFSRPGLP